MGRPEPAAGRSARGCCNHRRDDVVPGGRIGAREPSSPAPLSLATTYAYVNPAVAVVLGALFLSEPLTANVLVGGAIIIAAVAWVISAEARARRRPLPTPDAGACPLEPA